MRITKISLAAAIMLLMIPTIIRADYWTDPYDVVWTTPSKDASGSMPLGNGEVGINLWVEENGDLNFYISRTDSFSEISRLLKVGQVRVAITPNPFVAGAKFEQRLHLHDGVCEISAGEGTGKVTLKIFVGNDEICPVVYLNGNSTSPVSLKATVVSWRSQKRVVPKAEQKSAWTMHDAPFDLIESADIFKKENDEDAVCWYHRNEDSVVRSTLELQSLESVSGKVSDPLLHRTFGGCLRGEGFTKTADNAIESKNSVNFKLRVSVPCRPSSVIEEWRFIALASTDFSLQPGNKVPQETEDWWHAFWDRSHIITNAGTAKEVHANIAENLPDELSLITRGYTLQRYVQACEGRGNYPIKFNGGIFTVEPKAMGQPFNADYRAWGDGFWWQNTRHMYHPMLASGDFEMMDPLFKMYESVRPMCEARAELYYHAKGCYFPETMSIWGSYSNGDYGWDRKGHQPGEVLCPWWQYAWNQGPELVGLLLDRWDYTNDPAFLKASVLPMARSVLEYSDTRFKKDGDGRIVLDPTQSIETYWHGVINDMPSTAGLVDITARLCALPADLTSADDRAFFEHMKAACPALPMQEKTFDGKSVRLLAPAQQYIDKTNNCENPELYAVWPFRLYGVGKPDLELAVAAYEHRKFKLPVGWGYDGNCAALLGMADESARILLQKCGNSNAGYRWPATWGPNFDWLPDQNHGGNLMETAQLMLLQCEGSKIRLLPAWPKKWDVSFKLHATGNTVVECDYRGGKIVKLEVTPAERGKDVVLP